MISAKRFSILSLALFGVVFNANADAAPSFYTQRYLNSGEYVYTDDALNTPMGSGVVRDYTGAPVEYGYQGGREWSFGNGEGGSFNRFESSEVYARSDLSSGELKASTSLYSGANLGGVGPSAFGIVATNATAAASFADSLSFTSGGTPYIWRSGDAFTFNMSVDGNIILPAGHATPLSSTAMTLATLTLSLYRTGGMQALANLSDFDYFAYAMAFGWDAATAEYNRLSDIASSYRIDSAEWCLGENLTMAGFCDNVYSRQVNLDNNGAAQVNYTFSPGGDFEFELELRTKVSIDLFYEDLYGIVDFSHTIKTGFTAPDDATVYSASGMFQNLQNLNAPTTGVPEPDTLPLLAIGLGAASWRRWRSRG